MTERLLRFRCAGCGNCCKEPVLPLTNEDARRITDATGDAPRDFVKFLPSSAIAMDHEPEAFLQLRQGRRVMTLRQVGGRCRYLSPDDRCSIYEARPLGCRVFPLNATFGKRDGKLRRLTLIQATTCEYELDGRQSVPKLRALARDYEAANARWHLWIREWNRGQAARRRRGLAARPASALFAFLGLTLRPPSPGTSPSRR